MRKILGLSFVLMAAAGLFMAASFTATQVEADGLEVGDIAPDFNLENIDGKMYSLERIADMYKEQYNKDLKGYIITFTCNTCPWAVKYEDRIIETHKKMVKMGYPVVAIQPNDPDVQPGDSMDKMKKRAEDMAFPLVYLKDEGQKVYPKFGASRTPHIYLLSADRKVQYIGALDDNANDPSAVEVNYVEAAVKALESGKEVDPNFTRAIGCTIKTKK